MAVACLICMYIILKSGIARNEETLSWLGLLYSIVYTVVFSTHDFLSVVLCSGFVIWVLCARFCRTVFNSPKSSQFFGTVKTITMNFRYVGFSI